MATWFDDSILRPEVAGFAGAMVGLFNAPGRSARERAFNLLAGLSVAWFIAPWVSEYFSINTKNGQMAVAFIVGLVGMNLVAKGIDYIRLTKLSDLPGLRQVMPPSNDQTKERKP